METKTVFDTVAVMLADGYTLQEAIQKVEIALHGKLPQSIIDRINVKYGGE